MKKRRRKKEREQEQAWMERERRELDRGINKREKMERGREDSKNRHIIPS